MKKILIILSLFVSVVYGQNTHVPAPSIFYANYFSEVAHTSGTLASNFTTNGATATITGQQIALTGTSNTTSLDITSAGYTCQDNWSYFMGFRVATVQGAATYGPAIGIRSKNTHADIGIYAYLNLASGLLSGNLLIASNYPITANLAQSSGTISYTNGDSIEITLEKIGTNFYATARNATTNSAVVYAVYNFVLQYNAATYPPPNPPNTGYFSLYGLGGTNNIGTISIYSKTILNPIVAIVGDSKSVPFFANNGWPSLLRQYIPNTIVLAGGGDRTTDVLNRLPEIIRGRPKYVLLEIGTNDPYASFPTDSNNIKTNIASIITQLQAANIIVYPMCFYQAGNAWRYNWLVRTYPTLVIDCFNPLKQTGALSPDSVHPWDRGDSLIANQIITSGLIPFSVTPAFQQAQGAASVGAFINNGTTLQTANLNISGIAKAITHTIANSSTGSDVTIVNPGTSATVGMGVVYPANNNSSSEWNIVPHGTGPNGFVSGLTLHGKDWISNQSIAEGYANVYIDSAYVNLLSSNQGGGTTLPIKIQTGSAAQVVVNIDGTTTTKGGFIFDAASGSGSANKLKQDKSVAAGYGWSILVPTTTNASPVFAVSPNGTGQATALSQIYCYNTDVSTTVANYGLIGVRAVSTTLGVLGSAHVGSGTASAIMIAADYLTNNSTNSNQLLLNTNGTIQMDAMTNNSTFSPKIIVKTTDSVLRQSTLAQLLNSGQTTLVSGTKAVTITGLTTGSRAFVTLVSQGGTSTTTYQYAAVCTASTLTITAITTAGATVTTDTSVLNYFVIP